MPGACLPGFADCDGEASNGCEVNLSIDPNHCSSCSDKCVASGGTPTCVNGVCGVSSCNPGLGDCIALVPGCETNLLTATLHCGYCGNVCSFFQASAACTNGTCHLAQCQGAFGNCDGNQANGCETNSATSLLHCGGCNQKCVAVPNAQAQCVAGKCLSNCSAGFGDCVSVLEDGCETNLLTSPSHCGGCGLACSTNHLEAVSCVTGNCTGTCATGWADCNNNLRGDGCEANVMSDPVHCGACGRVCSNNHVPVPSCFHSTCNGACAPGWGDCDGNRQSNGCETNLKTDPNNCGACGDGCGECGICSNGSCVVIPCD